MFDIVCRDEGLSGTVLQYRVKIQGNIGGAGDYSHKVSGAPYVRPTWRLYKSLTIRKILLFLQPKSNFEVAKKSEEKNSKYIRNSRYLSNSSK